MRSLAPKDRVSLVAEIWLSRKLKRPDLFSGLTDATERRERLRKAITEQQLEDVEIGKRDGKPETYAQTFARLYGQPLTTNEDQDHAESGQEALLLG